MSWFSKNPEVHGHSARGEARPSVTELNDHLLIGEYPDHNDVAWLKDQFSITAVHNLQDDHDLRIKGIDIVRLRQTCEHHGIKLVRSPIPDGSADEMAARLQDALQDLAQLLNANERVYLHCNAGLNRAPTLAIAYLRAHGGMSLDEAMAHVKQRRPCGPFMTVLEEYFGPRDFKPGGG